MRSTFFSRRSAQASSHAPMAEGSIVTRRRVEAELGGADIVERSVATFVPRAMVGAALRIADEARTLSAAVLSLLHE